MKFRVLLKLLFTLTCQFLLLTSVVGQGNPNYQARQRAITTEHGLINRHINAVLSTSANNFWFVTDNKISQYYQGDLFHYTLDTPVSNRGLNQIVADKKGNLWIAENYEWYFPFNCQQLFYFNTLTKKFSTANQVLGRDKTIHSIKGSPDGLVYISTKSGDLYQLDSISNKSKLLGNYGARRLKILYANTDKIVVCTEINQLLDDKIITVSRKTGEILQEVKLNNEFVKSVVEKRGQYYYLTLQEGSIFIKSLHDARFNKFISAIVTNQFNGFSSLSFDSSNQLFIINRGEYLDFYDVQFNLVKSLLINATIHSVSVTTEGNIFLSTSMGIRIISLYKNKIITFLNANASESNSVLTSTRNIIKISPTELIVNTNQKRQHIDLKSGVVKSLPNFKKPTNPGAEFVLSAMKDANGDLLFGEDALVRFNLKTWQDEVLLDLDTTKIWSMMAYKTGYLLGLEKGGIYYYDKKTRSANKMLSNQDIFKSSIVYQLANLKGSYYLASELGFYELKPGKENNLFTAVKLFSYPCYAINPNSHKGKKIQVATEKGIWNYDAFTQKLSPFSLNEAQAETKFLSVYSTPTGVWASSEVGVWYFDNSGRLLKIIRESEGLTSRECNRISHFKDERGILYFGGINGINIIDPSLFEHKTSVAKLRIDTLQTSDNKQIKRTHTNWQKANFYLTRGETGLSISLAYDTEDYHCQTIYSYSFQGNKDEEWHQLSGRQLTLNNLPFGNSVIKIRAVSCDNYEAAQYQTLTIYRPHPLFLTWYFWLSLLIGLGVVIRGFFMFQTDQLRKRNRQLNEVVEAQTLELRDNLALKDKLIALLVHDVRYPIQSFHDFSKKVAYLTQRNDAARLLQLGKETETRSRKVLWLIDELVYWVKGTQQNLPVTLEEFDVVKLAEQIVESYESELLNKSLKIKYSRNSFNINADYHLMVIILRNIIFNAISYAKIDSEILINFVNVNEQQSKIEVINLFNEVSKAESLGGMGIGMQLLTPLVTKSGITIDRNITAETYNTILHLYNQ